MKNYKVQINNADNIRDLLQTIYMLADEQLIQAQNEINKLANSTNLQDEIMDAKQKYAKAINDYLSIKDKAISKKLDIAKILSEILKHNGDVDATLSDTNAMKNFSVDFKKIRDIVNNSNSGEERKEVIDITKTK